MKNNADKKLHQLIRMVEARKEMEWLEIKASIQQITEDLKPSNLVANTLEELAKPEIKQHLVSSALSLLAGYLSRKIIVGKSQSPLRKTLGFLVQAWVSKSLAKKI